MDEILATGIDSALTITIFVLIIGSYAFVAKAVLGERKGVTKMEFDKHKESVQFKDNCTEIVKRIEQRSDDRHKEVTKGLDRIESLIRNGGGQ